MLIRGNATLAFVTLASLLPGVCSGADDKERGDGRKSSVQVGPRPFFSDWSGTVSYYASCMGLK